MTNYLKLEQFGFLKVAGVDAVSFLQGYTTCDLDQLQPVTATGANAALGAICNLQGRMVSSFLVVRDGQDLILRMRRELVAPTLEFLKKYIVFSKATLEDISDSIACYGSPTSSRFLESTAVDDGFAIGLGNRNEYWLTSHPGAAPQESGWADLEIEAGIAWVSGDTTEEYLPQMFNYHKLQGIDFEKGCYLGQEIVARAQYRGELKRRLHRVDAGNLTPGPLADKQGEIISAGSTAALAVVSNAAEEQVMVRASEQEALATPV